MHKSITPSGETIHALRSKPWLKKHKARLAPVIEWAISFFHLTNIWAWILFSLCHILEPLNIQDIHKTHWGSLIWTTELGYKIIPTYTFCYWGKTCTWPYFANPSLRVVNMYSDYANIWQFMRDKNIYSKNVFVLQNDINWTDWYNCFKIKMDKFIFLFVFMLQCGNLLGTYYAEV